LMAVRRDAGRKRSTDENYESTLAQHIVPFFGARIVDRIERRDVGGYAAALAGKRLAASSRIHGLNLLGSIFELAVLRGWAVRNPAAARDLGTGAPHARPQTAHAWSWP
ncbi:MAG: hypothetical protein M3071_21205, partial [Actinomycetota bacterium]|nr:hypothetical protein [Actinomycetota bacterium]